MKPGIRTKVPMTEKRTEVVPISANFSLCAVLAQASCHNRRSVHGDDGTVFERMIEAASYCGDQCHSKTPGLNCSQSPHSLRNLAHNTGIN